MKTPLPTLVVADTGPLVVLGLIDMLSAVAATLGPLAVPEAVVAECLVNPQAPGAAQVAQALAAGHLMTVPDATLKALDPAYARGLGAGETSVIAYAKQHKLTALVDDRKARATAMRLAVPVLGSGAVLLALKRAGHLPTVGQALAAWAAHGYFVAESVHQELRRRANEATAEDSAQAS